MNIEWETIATSTITLIILLILKNLLDLKLMQFLIKYLSWLPVRSLFREKPINIAGTWEEIWGAANSANFKEDIERHGHPHIKQLGRYCYAERIVKGTTYVVFGRIIDNFFVGDWYDKKDTHGYFGTFQLEIINSNTMEGLWIGHSKTERKVRSDIWIWTKNS